MDFDELPYVRPELTHVGPSFSSGNCAAVCGIAVAVNRAQ